MFGTSSLLPKSPTAANLKQATDVFEAYIGRTLQIDLRI